MTRFTSQPPTTESQQHTDPTPRAAPRPMTRAFPTPGPTLMYAYEELAILAAARGSAAAATDQAFRPWDPPTCTDPILRRELWEWLDAVVDWINTEYTWDAAAMIPTCWPDHPHLVHEIAVLADQRYTAGLAYTSTPLEEWHRYALPYFTDRMTNRIRSHCSETHQPWPGQPRHERAQAQMGDRMQRCADDQTTTIDDDPAFTDRVNRQAGEVTGVGRATVQQ